MLAGEWRMRLGRDAKGLPQPPERPSRDSAPGTSPTAPGALFNAMIAPFAGFGVRGAIWYQGESNAGSEEEATAYASLLPLVIRSWRAAFEQPDMPFGVVSLAAFKEHRPDSPTHGGWMTVESSADAPKAVGIPPGVAHGYYALEDLEMIYLLTEVYDPGDEFGIRYDTVGADWGLPSDVTPIVSERAETLPTLEEFEFREVLA